MHAIPQYEIAIQAVSFIHDQIKLECWRSYHYLCYTLPITIAMLACLIPTGHNSPHHILNHNSESELLTTAAVNFLPFALHISDFEMTTFIPTFPAAYQVWSAL